MAATPLPPLSNTSHEIPASTISSSSQDQSQPTSLSAPSSLDDQCSQTHKCGCPAHMIYIPANIFQHYIATSDVQNDYKELLKAHSVPPSVNTPPIIHLCKQSIEIGRNPSGQGNVCIDSYAPTRKAMISRTHARVEQVCKYKYNFMF